MNYFNFLIRNKSYGINKKEIELSKNISQLINLGKHFMTSDLKICFIGMSHLGLVSSVAAASKGIKLFVTRK